MLLQNLLKGNPEEVFIYLERNVNSRFPLQQEYIEVPDSYRPDIGADIFELPFSVIKDSEVDYHEVSPDVQVRNLVNDDGRKFFIHPVMVEDYLQKKMFPILGDDGSVLVSPTSSTRTVMTRNLDKNFMLKVNLERRLGERIRKLKKSQVEHSRKIMQELDGLRDGELPDVCGYFPESIGMCFSVCNSHEDSTCDETGMLVREFQVRPLMAGKRFYIPFFSLFSLDKKSRDDDPLLAQIIGNLGNGKDELDVFVNYVLSPLISSWAYFPVRRGINPDIHAQNVLLEIDEDGIPVRIVYRDFQEFFVDVEKRERNGLSIDFSRNLLYPEDKVIQVGSRIITTAKERRRVHYGHTYDYRIGTILDYFTIVLSKFPCCTGSRIRNAAREIFREQFDGLEKEIFPEKAYVYPKGIHDFSRKNLIECEPKYR